MKFFDVSDNAHGVIAIGGSATGVIALGQAATGVIAIGQVARGGLAIGQGALGLVAVGQGAVGLFWSAGMLAVGGKSLGMLALGARARGLLPMSLWPRTAVANNGQPPPVPVPHAALVNHRIERGWVRAHLVPGEGSALLTVNATPLPVFVRLPQWVPRFERDVLAFLVWEQEAVPSSDAGGDYRSAPATRSVLTCSEVLDAPTTSARTTAWIGRIATVLMLIAVAGAVGLFAIQPVVQGITDAGPPAPFLPSGGSGNAVE